MKGTQDRIKHVGSITAIEGNLLHVKMMQSSACSGCHAAKLCQSSETKEKEVDVVVRDASRYKEGQSVLLVGSVRQGLKATVWAYMLPIILLVAVLVTCVKCGLSEVASALVSMGSLVPYFFGLYLFRDKFREQFSFSVEDLS